MEPIIAVIIVGALLSGVAVGWWLASRSAGPLRSDCDELRRRCSAAETGSAASEERAKAGELLRLTLDGVRDERDEARREADRLKTGAAEREKAFEARIAELGAMKDGLVAQFKEVSAQALGDAQKNFLERADARFNQAGEKHEEKLKTLLGPVESTLKRYEEGLTRVEKEREGSYRELNKAVDLLREGHGQARDETAKLVNALRSSPKARGRWGEQSLKNVLEQAGLSQFADFQTEVSVNTGDGRLRPDVIVRLPGGRKLIIDAKCSLNAFLDAHHEVDEVVRAAHLKSHAGAIRNHALQLGARSYWQQFGDAADYVIMYIPGEHFLTAAMEQDDGLWDWAFERRVLLATPTNLVAIARTVASVWRQEKIAEEAAEIARLGKELHARLATMGSHVVKLGRNLELATSAYNSFVGSLESQVLTQAKRFESYEVSGGGKAIEPVPVIDTVPRVLTKLASEPVSEKDQDNIALATG